MGEGKDGEGGEAEARGGGKGEETARAGGAAQEAQRPLDRECSGNVVVVVVVFDEDVVGSPVHARVLVLINIDRVRRLTNEKEASLLAGQENANAPSSQLVPTGGAVCVCVLLSL